ncbi:transposase [Brevibacillus centrosporus]|uniref:RNA-guided endonuclease InsQ/TnpB family protein n=1 Tax=Brevibacillus centrosporus TaxID=54910 RepID=UPI000F0A16BF|nr:RNA-guided endonuclease TnpB family protein [Brevibacillus centrosporus]MEC2131387.1 transposase [Brevibacillus centrosporus]MED4906911.1 transposase [Brevibacillus centrosporus]RNB72587.1 transposase [Brevibacillus centrosporus]GED31599.1 transposase [Brevibacillus centrosporus]
MILAYKFRLKPTPEQEKQLWKSTGTARWAYNWTLDRQEENYRSGGKFIPDGRLRKELTQLKKTSEYSWLYEVSNNVTKQAVKDACDAYKRFFNKRADRPRFKSRKRSKPSFYNDTEKLKVKGKSVLIEKVGWVKTFEHLPENKNYTNPRVSFDGKYWYLSVGVERGNEESKRSSGVIGVDMGIKKLAVCSNGMMFRNINKTKAIRKTEKRLRRLQCRVSRKYEMNKEGSRYAKTGNIVKVEKRIRLLHRRLTNIRNNHIHQATAAIAKTKPSAVVMEALNLKEMMKNRYLSKAIAQQKLHEFKRQMQYKCQRYGISFIEADKWYPSSKLCSSCGHIKRDLKLSDRTFRCDCGLTIDRDVNAALNLAKLAS